jgi:hypothetical protein
MRELRELNTWTLEMREASDEDLLRQLVYFTDEVSQLHEETGEMVLRLDHLTTVVGERWAPEALQQLEEEEQVEIERERR